MKNKTIAVYFLLFGLAACSLGGGETAGGELPTPEITTNSAPNVEAIVRAYLDAWKAGDYEAMYAMLTTISRDSVSLEDFVARYQNVAAQANLSAVEYELLQTLVNPQTAQVGYRVTLQSAIVAPITRETSMDLSKEGGEWRVVWDERLILPELAGGNTLSLERFVPARGNIYDRNGNLLATTTEAVAVGVLPWNVAEEDVNQVLTELARVSGRRINELNSLMFPEEGEQPYYLPVAEVTAEQFNSRAGDWSDLTGVRYESYTTRLYPSGTAGAQTIGYYGAIPAEQVEDYIPLGYQSDDRIGRQGIERWGEEYLAGKRGGSLYVLNPEGEVVTILAEASSQPAASITTTLDRGLQIQAQEAIKDFDGAIVVLERDTGRVLAMVSSPTFNPNWADLNSPNSFWGDYFPDDAGRFFNRAAQGQFPPGSIFKVVTMSAALESGLFSPTDTLDCQNQWYGLANTVLDNWTLEKELPPDGTLTLVEGLMRSCNPWFYQIGLDLYNDGQTHMVADMAQGFGLGSPTGIQTLVEESGSVEVPDEDPETGRREAVQQGIGQGTTTITPLQAAVYAAALGNGGTLYRPQMIESVENTDGSVVLQFQPEPNGTLPISEDTLAAVREGMRLVTSNTRGTAYRRFTGFGIPVYGKTGTATVEGNDPHAWFIGFTEAGRPSQPDIAIAVLVENIGDGSEFAAPIFRRMASYYFFGTPGPLYPWESEFGVLNPEYFEETPEEENPEATPEEGGPIVVTPSP